MRRQRMYSQFTQVKKYFHSSYKTLHAKRTRIGKTSAAWGWSVATFDSPTNN